MTLADIHAYHAQFLAQSNTCPKCFHPRHPHECENQ